MKSFRQHFDEKNLPEVYLDMDGVVCDWLLYANKVLEKNGYPHWRCESWKEFCDEQRDEIRWSILKKQENFYADMPFMKEGKKLWRFLKPYRPHILSSVEKRVEHTAKDEKLIWLEQNMGINNLAEINLVEHFTKHEFAINEQGKPNILIDDYELNCTHFEEAGGIAILHTNAKDTIKELKKIGFK